MVVRGKHKRVLTGWTVYDETLAAHTILSKLVGWPLLVTPEAVKFEPIATLRSLVGPPGSCAGPNGNRTVGWIIPETSVILGDVPHGTFVRLVFQKVKWDMLVIVISRGLDARD